MWRINLTNACIRFYRVSTLTGDIDIAILSFRPSVRLSVRPFVRGTLLLYENGLTYRHSFYSPYGIGIAQSFQFYRHQTSSRNSDGVTHCGGVKYRWGIKISRFSTNKSLYLVNDTRYRHSYYGRRIGSRRQVSTCYLQTAGAMS